MGKELEGRDHKILDAGNFLVLKITVLEMIFFIYQTCIFWDRWEAVSHLVSHVYSRTLWPYIDQNIYSGCDSGHILGELRNKFGERRFLPYEKVGVNKPRFALRLYMLS